MLADSIGRLAATDQHHRVAPEESDSGGVPGGVVGEDRDLGVHPGCAFRVADEQPQLVTSIGEEPAHPGSEGSGGAGDSDHVVGPFRDRAAWAGGGGPGSLAAGWSMTTVFMIMSENVWRFVSHSGHR